jgi:hypothetical protein
VLTPLQTSQPAIGFAPDDQIDRRQAALQGGGINLVIALLLKDGGATRNLKTSAEFGLLNCYGTRGPNLVQSENKQAFE